LTTVGITQLGPYRLAEADDGVLGRRVGSDPRQAGFARLRGDIDDVAAAPRAQALDCQLGAGDDAVQVDVDLAVDRVLALVLQRRHRHDPGVVDHRVDRAELAFGLVEEVGEGATVGDIERQRDGAAAQLRRRLLRQLELEVADGDAASLRDQRRRRRLADPPRTAGDRHDLAAE
jgi:hypothetical protein